MEVLGRDGTKALHMVLYIKKIIHTSTFIAFYKDSNLNAITTFLRPPEVLQTPPHFHYLSKTKAPVRPS